MAAPELSEMGGRLTDIRNESGLSQKAFAEMLGTSIASYQRYEAGDRELPLHALIALYKNFRINPIWILMGDVAGPRSIASLDEQATLLGNLYEAIEKPIAVSGKPVSYRERRVVWDLMTRRALSLQSVPDQEIKVAIKQLLREDK